MKKAIFGIAFGIIGALGLREVYVKGYNDAFKEMDKALDILKMGFEAAKKKEEES